ncbi:MAG: PhzF family phenazine biosynthesis isomerase [Schleiferiaceae bacterium]|nr:PhzF family phenazine biosynthesis isomerase [Schleiferiaceae bacterium]
MSKDSKALPFTIVSVFSDFFYDFLGNPTAVIFMNDREQDSWYQKVASDFNQPATTFLLPLEDKGHFEVRWFAPDAEIDLCGHGSLGAGAAVYDKYGLSEIVLHPQQGVPIKIKKQENQFTLSLAPIPCQSAEIPEGLEVALGAKIQSFHTSANKQIVVLESEKIVASLKPNFSKLAEQKYFGFVVTAPGHDCDFVSRTFVAKVQQLEDFATGSSHAVLVPFWSEQLNRNKLIAKQLSRRGGFFSCDYSTNMVKLTGNYRLIAEGEVINTLETQNTMNEHTIQEIHEYLSGYVDLSEAETRLFCAQLRHDYVKKNRYLFKKGEENLPFIWIKSGYLMTYYTDHRNQDHVMQFGSKNWWTGDIEATLNNKPTRYSMRALSDCEIFTIPLDRYNYLLEKAPKFEKYFRIIYLKSLASHQKRIINNISLTAAEKYDSFIERFPKMELVVPQKYIASYLGITPEFLSKLKGLRLKEKQLEQQQQEQEQ